MAKAKEVNKLEKLNEGVCVNFQLGYWGASAKLDVKKLGKDVPKKIVRGMQDLLDDKLLVKDIYQVLRQAKYLVTGNSLPFPIDAVNFVPKSKIKEIDEGLQELDEELSVRVEKLCEKYDTLRKRFKKKYPQYYQPNKYPSKDALRNRFYMRWTFFEIGLPDAAASVLDPAEYKRVQNRMLAMVDEMEEMTMNLVASQVFERLEKLHKQCVSGEGLHGKTVGSINRFLEKWQELWSGHVDDQKMKMVMSRLRKEMKKVSIDRLKDNEAFREETSFKLANIMEKIENIPNVQLKRKLDI